MRAKDLMKTRVMSVLETDGVEDLLDALVSAKIHSVPVVDQKATLVGVVTQQDVFFASATQPKEGDDSAPRKAEPLCVRDIMTAPAVSAEENIDIRKLCRLMSEMRIHRIPITRKGRLAGIVSSLDICSAVSSGADF